MSVADVLTCDYFTAGRCRSCTTLGTPYTEALAAKQAKATSVLSGAIPTDCWLEPASSSFKAFRNKAKFAVGGTVEQPTLGITRSDGKGVDLRECGVHEQVIWDVVPDLAGFVTLTRLSPYDVAVGSGSLKFIIVTANPDGELLVRFVVRERAEAEIIRRHLPRLLRRLPQIISVSVNLHPEHKAVLEGAEEIHLFGPTFFPFRMPDHTLYLHHRSFFQTNTQVAAQLYRQARKWADEVAAQSVLDLYCGVGGFGMYLAATGRRVVGIEIESDAVAAAQTAARELPGTPEDVKFLTGDATVALTGEDPFDVVVVNPPRRGLGEQLCTTLDASDFPYVVYSSCNPTSLAADLDRMKSLTPVSARLFDMFPQTEHCEVAVLLRR